MRIEHRTEHTARLSLAVMPDSRYPASRAAATKRPASSTLDASTERMKGSKRSTSVHSGSASAERAAAASVGSEGDDPRPSPPSPSLRRTALTTASASAGSWLT